jgi:hypothetical protein
MFVSSMWKRLEGFLFPLEWDTWLSVLRIGVGAQMILYCLSLREDWNSLFAQDGTALINRDLQEAIIGADSPLTPTIGWFVAIGDHLGIGEAGILFIAWICLLFAGCCLLVGLYCRSAAVIAWLLHLSAVTSAGLFSYGVDNFSTIGLFYLMLSPLPDRCSLDSRLWTSSPKDPRLHGFFRRVLQLHLCLIYFFGGIAKCAGIGWWNGASLWRALTRPPFNVVSPDLLISWKPILSFAAITVCLLETAYPVFIWMRRTRFVWLACILAMHIAIGVTMGLYLFALIMIVLNVAAFGPDFSFSGQSVRSLGRTILLRTKST